MTPENPDRLVWIDLEMTGLNPDFDRIIEIATVITNHDLDVVAEGPVLAISAWGSPLGDPHLRILPVQPPAWDPPCVTTA